MKKSLAILAVAGMATAAGAQGYEFRVSNVVDMANPSATVELWASFSASDHAFAGAGLTASAGESGWVAGTPLELGNGEGIGTAPGVIAGGDVTGIIAGQLHFPPPIQADVSNPIKIWQADWGTSDFTMRDVALSTTTTKFDVYVSPTTAVSESRLAGLTEGRGVIQVVPAPASLALLGLGGLAAARRRR